MTDLVGSAERDNVAALKLQIDRLRGELAARQSIEDALREAHARHDALHEHFTAIVEASAMLTGKLEPSAVLASILRLSERLLPADAHAIWRHHANSGRWQITSALGLSEEYKRTAIGILDETPGMPDAPVVADDVDLLPMLGLRREAYRAEGIRSLLVVPLRTHGQVCGTLAFYFRQPHRFTDREVQLATAVAHLSAAAMAAADLFAEHARLENRFARFMQHLPGLAWIKDLRGRYVYANEAAMRAFQREAHHLYGRHDDEIFPPQTAAQFKENDRRALASPAGIQVVESLKQPDGVVHHSIVSKFPIPDHSGEPALVGGMAIDITEQRRAEEDARFLANASEALAGLDDYESALENVVQLAVPTFADWAAVDLFDDQGVLRRVAVAHVDPAKVELVHEVHRRYPTDPNARHGIWNIVRNGRSELVSEITEELLSTCARDADHLRLLQDVGLRSYLGIPLAVRGRVLGMITFIVAESGRRYDLHDLALAEDLANRAAIAIENATLYQALKEADRRKDEFLALLGHELRNPLAPISNSLSVLKLPGADASIGRQAREMMERQVEHMVRLVDDLLDVSRIMRGKIELRREAVELAAVVARAVETSQPRLDAEGHRLTVLVASECLLLYGDLVRLAQVISNLLDNAAKYTERGGQIWLTAIREGNEAVVRVRDTGIGIAPAALPRLFDMFYQAERRTRKSQGGLGIGLSLVRGLAQLHGGTAEAHSDGLGAGSEFVVRLPLLEHEAPATPPPAAERAEDPLPLRRVLVVDDNVDAADSLAMLLRLQGQQVTAVYDGSAALAQAEAAPPAIAFIDLGMPKMDGYEVARAFRAHATLQNVTLVALTGWGQPEDRQRTAEAGFHHHLVKPVDLKTLRHFLIHLIPAASG
ncbi:MAG TPA: ATP-binding protein [Pirellulales bacterium]|nr:ATP-binding protein [Pirellulales bacterium]